METQEEAELRYLLDAMCALLARQPGYALPASLLAQHFPMPRVSGRKPSLQSHKAQGHYEQG